jgi:probable addiction module antidote protein
MPPRPYPRDRARDLGSDAAIAAYLETALASDDPAVIVRALGVAARARGMTRIAEQAGLSRESLYRALGENGKPRFGTVMRVAKALGVRLAVVAGE